MDEYTITRGLNPEQMRAVQHGTGPLMILAGAGAGKTAVITRRAALLVARGTLPERLLVVTFTNKAAREIRDRCQILLGADTKVAAGTFHSLILRHILRTADQQGLLKPLGFLRPSFVILDKSDSVSLWKAAWKHTQTLAPGYCDAIDWNLKKSLRVIGALRAQGQDLWVGAFGATSLGRTPEGETVFRSLHNALFHESLSPQVDRAQLAELLLHLWDHYTRGSRSLNAVDFDGILTIGCHLLQSHAAFAAHRAALFDMIEVDEYQDTNPVQNTILDILAAPHRNLAICGDDRQAIYGFRGSDIGVIRHFRDRYPEAVTVDLIRNYRSHAGIVTSANTCAQAMPDRLSSSDMLAMAASLPTAPVKPSALYYQDDHDEAEGVAGALEAAHAEGLPWSSLAILYRQRRLKDGLEETLVQQKIPYVIVNDIGFFERKDVADFLALIRLLLDSENLLSWKRVLTAGSLGVSAQACQTAAQKTGSAWSAMTDLATRRADKTPLLAVLLDQIARFSKALSFSSEPDIARVSAGVRWPGVPPATLSDYLIALWTLFLYPPLRAVKTREITRKFPHGGARAQEIIDTACEAYAARAETVASWVESLAHGASGSWHTVLDDMALQTDISDGDDCDAVKLMTIHASKGLEFARVWYLGGGDTDANARPEEFAEERRVFYVAITRAQHALTITGADMRTLNGYPQARPRSQFAEEIASTVFSTIARLLGKAVSA